MRFGKQGQTAFGDEVDAAGGDRVLDHVQVAVEADSKIGIVPCYQGPFEPGQQEPEILAQRLEVHGLIRHAGVDTKCASVWAPQAAEHGNHFEEGRFPQRRFDKLPSLAYAWEVSGLLRGRQVDPHGPVLREVLQDVKDRTPIREAQHIVEITRGIFRVTAGVRPPDHGDCPSRAEQITQGVRRVRGFGERADENDVDILRQLRQQIFKSGVTNEGNFMPFLFAPDPDNLGHDTGEAGVHYACVQSPRRTPGDDVDNPDPQLFRGSNHL